jgi:hypothetical protein
MTEQITWMESEWATDGEAAYLDGFDADVYRDEIADDGWWVWTVRATALVSEWPELQASGRNRTKEVAKRKAEVALRRAAKLNGGRRVTY